jgi:tetratricopeptide (TPR) repeat protein
MPYVEGSDLATILKEHTKLTVPRALRISRGVVSGLVSAHAADVVHRDLKPANIMIDTDDEPMLMDFGIARSAGGPGRAALPPKDMRGVDLRRTAALAASSTMAGAIVGTVAYMAPEQARGVAVDQRADIYAFGLILYDMLVGGRRSEKALSAIDELQARMQKAPPPPRTIDPLIPEAVDAIVRRCLEPDPENRFQTTVELESAFAALDEQGNPIPVELPRARWPAVVVGVLLTALLGGAAWWAGRPQAAKEPVSVLIANFTNETGDPVFDGVVEEALALGIESASFVTIYPRREALRIAATIKPGAPLNEETARLVALREGVSLVLTGEVSADGAGYSISTRVLEGDGEHPKELYRLAVEAPDKNSVLDAVGRMAGEVREQLGDNAVPRAGPAANETFTAASIEAARAYTTAQEFQVAGKLEDAIQQYGQALKLDPEMGRAYAGLAAQYANLGRRDEAESNYQQALARIDRMTDREKFRTRGSYYLFARKPDLAAKEFTSLVHAYPADSSGLSNLALAAFYQRDMAQALEQGRRAAAIFPRNVLRRSNVALYAMYAGQFEDAIKAADAVHEINPNHVKAFLTKGLSLLALGRAPEATDAFQKLAATGDAGASFAAAGLADLAQYEGRLTDAAAILENGIAANLAVKNAASAASKRVALAQVQLAQNDRARAASSAELAVQESESDTIRACAGFVLAAAARMPQAEDLAKKLVNRLENDAQAYGWLIRAEIAMAAEEPRTAVEHARAAQKLADTWLGRVILGRAYLGLEAFPEAYSEFEAALKRRGEATSAFLDDVPTFRYLPPVHYYMGLAQLGLHSPAAAESFKTFLAIKQNGDEKGLVADARRRVEKR